MGPVVMRGCCARDRSDTSDQVALNPKLMWLPAWFAGLPSAIGSFAWCRVMFLGSLGRRGEQSEFLNVSARLFNMQTADGPSPNCHLWCQCMPVQLHVCYCWWRPCSQTQIRFSSVLRSTQERESLSCSPHREQPSRYNHHASWCPPVGVCIARCTRGCSCGRHAPLYVAHANTSSGSVGASIMVRTHVEVKGSYL